MFLKYRIIVLLLVMIGMGSCGIFFQKKSEPIARFCYFDPSSKSLIYNGNKDGIIKIEMNLLSDDNKFISTYLNKNYTTPIRKIDLSLMDTVLLMGNTVQIKVWDKSPILEDYDLRIDPINWKRTKLVYCRYNTR